MNLKQEHIQIDQKQQEGAAAIWYRQRKPYIHHAIHTQCRIKTSHFLG